MMEWVRSNFRTIWWVVVLVFFSLITLEIWTPILGFGDFRYIKSNIIIVFLVWIALLLWPLFKEINLFGFSLKKEIDSLKSEVKEQRLEFREQIVNLKSEIRIQNTILLPTISQGVKSTMDVGTVPPDLESKQLSDEALKVLSTLWKHQQQYDPKLWGFVIGPGNPHYRTYAIGVGDTMKLGLTSVSPDSGMVFLTVDGIEYCRRNQAKLLVDWEYQRWQKLGAAP